MSRFALLRHRLPDTIPDAFSFTDVSNALLSTVKTSNTITVSGINAPTPAAISGDASSQWQKNAGTWSTGPFTVVLGDAVAVRHTSSASNSTAVDTTLTIGGVSDTFTSTTIASGSVPAITAVTASGVAKRKGVPVGISVDDDGTATSYRYDVQANGVSLTGVSIRDGTSAVTADFPYISASNYIQFDPPSALTLQPYTITGDARTGGGSWAGATAANENFNYQSDQFTPDTRAAPTLTRLTSSGTTAMQVQITGPTYEGDNLRIQKFNGSNTLLVTSLVPLMDSPVGSSVTIALDGSFDPQPEPPLGTTTSDNYFKFAIETADYLMSEGGVTSGISSAFSIVSVTDPLGHRYWKFTETAGSFAVLRYMECASSVGGIDLAQGRTYIFTPSNCQSTSGGFQSLWYFDGNNSTLGSFDTNTSGLPAAVTIDFGVNVDLHELRMKSAGGFEASAPGSFTFAYSDNGSTFTTVKTLTGLTWATEEVKTWSW